jgi:Na+-transporting NADH:ubiquinone oxidoreductase subunit NqrB
MRDARIYQILFLGSLLSLGVFFREFSLRPEQMALTFSAGLATQALFLHIYKVKQGSYLSALVTCFGLSLLLRSDNDFVHPACAFIAIASKFLVRFRGKHVFNPANLGVVCGLSLMPGAWVSAGQWGNDLVLAGWILMLGFSVSRRASRLDISWAFLLSFLGFCGLRILCLGQSCHVWLHQAQSGALLLFSFFMISDPMTTPNHPKARIAYALAVALCTFCWQFLLFRINGMILSLFFLSPLVPFLDRLWKFQAFHWSTQPTFSQGSSHAFKH